MPTKRFDKKHWKMVVVLLAICGAIAMLLLRWAAMIWG
ncbi:small membrane protein YniD [Escherichia coli]|nr:small membrane protein YniD [Escherichia coli]MDC9098976.1 small membrane protein YniD [Escherichia coli]